MTATRPVWSVARERRITVEPHALGEKVLHYSIPNLGEFGGPRIEDTDTILSQKLKVEADDVLVGRLNPRKGRVVRVRQVLEGATVASTEFVPLKVRPDQVDPRYLMYVLQSEVSRAALDAEVRSVTRSHQRVDPYYVLHLPVPDVPLAPQRGLADFLDDQVERIAEVQAAEQKVLDLLDERVASLIGQHMYRALQQPYRPSMTPMKEHLRKLRRSSNAGDAPTVTAFRDGQVIARELRRATGYTETASDDPAVQGVAVGDVVVHGLDGFSGAIGTSESDGVCSPANHVCAPLADGDPDFYGRLLRVLAVSGYLSLYGGSARERAVDYRNWEKFSQIPLPVVVLADQQYIGDLVRLGRPTRSAIDRAGLALEERKRALITACVSGEFDVTTASGRAGRAALQGVPQ